MNTHYDNSDDIEIIMKQLNISYDNASLLLTENHGNIVNAISNYIDPKHTYIKKHYNTTYNTNNEKLDIITELRNIVTEKEEVFTNIKKQNSQNSYANQKNISDSK
jgi:hypothetical protein